MGWVIGTRQDHDELTQLFRPVRFSRRLDRAGYVRFRHWRLYGERGLPKQGAFVWLSDEMLTLGDGEEPLAYHMVIVDRKGQLAAVPDSRPRPTRHQSRQPWLWDLSSEEWLLALRRPVPQRRQRRRPPTPAAQPLARFDLAAFAAARSPVTTRIS